MGQQDIAAVVAAVMAALGQGEAGANTPDVHMLDTVDNRKYMGSSDKATCKGWKKPAEYHIAVAGRDNSIRLAQSGAARCGQTEIDAHGYCRYHKDQRGVPEERIREYQAAHPTKTFIPMPDKAAVEELARMLGVKVLGEAKPAANAA